METKQKSLAIKRSRAEDTNPCHKEHDLSLKCLNDTGYNRSACEDYFQNYNNCKAFWNFVYKQRKKKGIKPYLPTPEERPLVKQEYLPFFKL